ncbi:hypothetical protein L6164_017428 [Bauhinia variegata]|uniref:Uncharacterized protein n=1 Tax=Bauhinia variegata TaxID=167791 RepID=A0ACB9N825_BAUVA|nr:hypothetical protein L6164_017428 [Bauhinia variegata]
MSTKGASLASTTRLSPLAKPFELNRSNHQLTSSFSVLSPDYCSSDPFASLLEPLYKRKVGSKVDPVVSAPLVDYVFGDEISHATFPDEAAVQYPSMEFQGSGEFVVLDESKFDMISDTDLGYVASSGNKQSYWTEGADYFENLSGKGEIGSNSAADRDMLNKGKHAADGLSPCLGASNGAFGKDTSTNDILSKSEVTRQADAGSNPFLTSSYEVALSVFPTSDITSPAKLKHSLQNQSSVFPSIVTDSNLVSTGTSDWQNFPSCLSNDISNSTENHSAGFHGLSSSGLALSRLKVCSANILDEVNSESHGSKAGASTETSSKPSGGDDSDLDSPCWKGRLASSQSPSEIPGPVTSQHFHKDLEKRTSLNPLAPQFIPSNVGGSTFNGLVCMKDGSVSSQSSAPLSFNEGVKTTTVEAHPSDLKKETQLQCSSNVFEREKEFDLINNPKSSSVLSSACMTQPCSFEHHSLLKRSPVTTTDIEDCTKGAKEALASGSISGSFPAKGHSTTPSSSSSRVGVITDPFKIFQDVSKSSIESPEPDVRRIVNAMYVLSELLVQTCANGLDSYNEHDHNVILQIINMLNAISKNYGGQGVPTLESTHTGSPYCNDWSPELPKGFEVASMETLAVPNSLYHKNDNEGQSSVSKVVAEKANEIVQPLYKGFEVTSMKPMTVNELDRQNDNQGQTNVSKVVAEKGWHPFSSSSGTGSKKANGIVQPLNKGFEVTSMQTLADLNKLYHQNVSEDQSNASKVVAEKGWYSFSSSSGLEAEKANGIVQAPMAVVPSNKGFAVTSMGTLAIPHSVHHQNDYDGQSRVSKVIAEKAGYSFPSSSGVGTEKAYEIDQLQVIRRGLGKSQDVEEQIDPQTFLFRNLWLDSEAERCFMKYKAYCRLMETGVDVNRTNIMDLWR